MKGRIVTDLGNHVCSSSQSPQLSKILLVGSMVTIEMARSGEVDKVTTASLAEFVVFGEPDNRRAIDVAQ